MEICMKETLRALRQKKAVMTAAPGEVRYTAPLVNRTVHKPENSTKNYKGNACNLRLQRLQWPVYDFLRENSRFQEILALLEAHAE